MKFINSAKLLAFALLIGLGTIGSSHSHNELCDGFLPPNDMKIPVGFRAKGFMNNGGLTEQQFNAVIDRAESIYAPVIAAKGKTLKVNRLWSDATVNASAQQMGNDWVVNMYGGLARHGDITTEGFALVICHEIGHHIGGAPKVESFLGMNAWATNEGGSDYFATLKCLRQFFAQDNNTEILNGRTVDPLATQKCREQFSSSADQDICMRSSLAGESVAYLFQALRKETTRPSYATPDTTEVNKTNHDHPQTQCRMDTYLAGMLCQADLATANSDTDFKVGSCVQGEQTVGFRPRCWFNPNASTGGGDGSCPIGDQALCDAACQVVPTLPFCKN